MGVGSPQTRGGRVDLGSRKSSGGKKKFLDIN